MSTSAPTHVVEVDGSVTTRYDFLPEDAGLTRVPPEAIVGGLPAENAVQTRAIFAGEPGPARDISLLNAGAAIYAAGRADDVAGGVRAAQQALDTGAAADALERYVALSQELA